MKYLAYSLIVTFCLLNTAIAEAETTKKVSAQSFIRIDGQNLIAPNGQKFFIKGTNLGNWLNPEGYMFLFSKASAPRLIDQAFKEMVGPDFMNEFWKRFKDNYVTRKDISYLKKTGVNTIRLPFHYKLFTDEDYMGMYPDLPKYFRAMIWLGRVEIYLLPPSEKLI